MKKINEELKKEFDYEIIKSKRKTGCIEIKPDGRVLVRVPNRMSQSQIDEMLAKKHDWILKHLSEIEKTSLSKESEEKLSEQDIKRLKRKAAQYLPERCRLYSSILGVSYKRISIRCQRTRWGSCSAKGNLNFNILLMLTPLEVIDYVVIHELCHRKQMNHSKAFWGLVESVMPDYKVHRQWLKENGNRLMDMLPDSDKHDETYYTYILRCSDGTFYTGYTNDITRRVKAHNDGVGAKYTRLRLPVVLEYYEEFETKEEAMRREALIKQLTRKQKEKLIGEGNGKRE